ncbi:MAG: 50S ribosomal protein L32 [Puniceicoccales bacterium]|nr:50S ribosomal protein L32 [Puniceicoccales bacterium]
MGQPKRKQSKQRSRKRRGANMSSEPQLARDPSTGNLFRPHHVNPETGMYRGRQVIETES